MVNINEVLATAGLIRYLYEDLGEVTGGPLHAELDDMNIDDDQLEDSEHWNDEKRYAYLHDGRFERHAQAGEDVSAEHKSKIQQTCELIMASFRRMPESHRAAAIAWANGWPLHFIQELSRADGKTVANEEDVAELKATLADEATRAATLSPGACLLIPCPPIERTALR